MNNRQIIPDIWNCLEVECWARGFSWESYTKHGGRLEKERYLEISNLFQKWMEEDIGTAQELLGVK